MLKKKIKLKRKNIQYVRSQWQKILKKEKFL